MAQGLGPMEIDASPVKEFFISMLIRDIQLRQAIADLVDNSVDGAHRLRRQGLEHKLWINLEIGKDRFVITDNCGGIPINVAQFYAFRFGRPSDSKDYVPLEHSVGQFGVGMKRALFKLGREFRVESWTRTSHFLVAEDVDKWKAKPDWTFAFEVKDEGIQDVPASNWGTTIEVTRLHDEVSEQFALENFVIKLKAELEAAQYASLESGIIITINTTPLKTTPFKLLFLQDQLMPAFREETRQEPGKAPITLRIYAGVYESDPEAAGWYVVCNGRLVLAHDQSILTGWGENVGQSLPRFHNQYARFRGYAFLDCDDGSLLPWNTTKTGVDANTPVFRYLRDVMLEMARPVITFLNRLDAETEKEATPLQELVREKAVAAELPKVQATKMFVAPPEEKQISRLGRVSYQKPREQIDEVKRVAGVTKNEEVGIVTFDYYYERECME